MCSVCEDWIVVNVMCVAYVECGEESCESDVEYVVVGVVIVV